MIVNAARRRSSSCGANGTTIGDPAKFRLGPLAAASERQKELRIESGTSRRNGLENRLLPVLQRSHRRVDQRAPVQLLPGKLDRFAPVDGVPWTGIVKAFRQSLYAGSRKTPAVARFEPGSPRQQYRPKAAAGVDREKDRLRKPAKTLYPSALRNRQAEAWTIEALQTGLSQLTVRSSLQFGPTHPLITTGPYAENPAKCAACTFLAATARPTSCISPTCSTESICWTCAGSIAGRPSASSPSRESSAL